MGLVGPCWVFWFRTHNELNMYLVGNRGLPPMTMKCLLWGTLPMLGSQMTRESWFLTLPHRLLMLGHRNQSLYPLSSLPSHTFKSPPPQWCCLPSNILEYPPPSLSPPSPLLLDSGSQCSCGNIKPKEIETTIQLFVVFGL